MKTLLLTIACLGVGFSGFASNAKAGGKPPVGTGDASTHARPRLVEGYQSGGQEIPAHR